MELKKMFLRAFGVAVLAPLGALMPDVAGATTVYHICSASGPAGSQQCENLTSGTFSLDQFWDKDAFSHNSYVEIDSVKFQFTDIFARTSEIRVQALDTPGVRSFGLAFSPLDALVNPWLARPSTMGSGDSVAFIGFDVKGANLSNYVFAAGFAEQGRGTIFSSASAQLYLDGALYESLTCADNRSPVTGLCTSAAQVDKNLSPDLLDPTSVELGIASHIESMSPDDYVGARFAYVMFDRPIPEPTSMALLGIGAGLMALVRRRQSA